MAESCSNHDMVGKSPRLCQRVKRVGSLLARRPDTWLLISLRLHKRGVIEMRDSANVLLSLSTCAPKQ